MCSKKEVLELLLVHLDGKLESLKSSRDETRKMARDAPSANQSHSDTSKFQLSNVQLGIDSVRLETLRGVQLLRQTPTTDCTTIKLGALFTIQETDKSANSRLLYLVPACGGETVKTEHVEFTTITPSAPLTKACLKKEIGDTFDFQGKRFEVLDIK